MRIHFRVQIAMTITDKPKIDLKELGRLIDNAERIYQDVLLPRYIDTHYGRYIVVDGRTGDHEIDQGDHLTYHRLKQRRPDAVTFSTRIGTTSGDSAFSRHSRLPSVVRFRKTYGLK